MDFTAFRLKHDVIRAEVKNLPRETLVKDLLEGCDHDAERIAVAQLLLGTSGTPVESLTTGIKETWLAKHLGLETKSLLDIRASLPGIWQNQDRLSIRNLSVVEFYEAVRRYCQGTDRSNAAKERIVRTAIGLPTWEDAFLALEILTGKVSNKLDALTIFYALSRRHPGCPFNGAWKDADKARMRRAFFTNPNPAFWVTAWSPLRDFWMPIDASRPTVGVPMAPQLADPGKDLGSIFDGRSLVMESKLDGERIHIHVDDVGMVRLFSRQLKEVTEEHPELCRTIGQYRQVRDSILDGELVAFAQDGSILPFAFVGRKDSSVVARKGVTVYDATRLAGQDLLDVPLRNRRELYGQAVANIPCLAIIDQTPVVALQDLQARLEACHEAGEEGLVVKDLDSRIMPGERDVAFTKAKIMYDSQLSDTVDCVVIGYNRGRGKRHGVIGALWLAVRDGDTYHPVTKVGTGFSEEALAAWTARLKEDSLDAQPSNVEAGNVAGDVQVWVTPRHVVEINAAEVSRSPRYSASPDAEGRGLSLRFPVLLRERPDKDATSATSVDNLVAMMRRPT